METTFATQDNAIYITKTFETFMKDKYSFQYTDYITQHEYYKLLGDTMASVFARESGKKSVGQMNVATLSELKRYFINNYITNVQSQQDSLEPIVEEKDDNEFFEKLQKMELTRKTFKTVVTPDILTPPPPPIDATTNNYVPTAITTVYMPAPIKIGKEVKIYSWQRDWINEPNRNYFTWKGPLPKFVDRTNTRIGCMICPKSILQDTNIVSLIIEGANSDEVSVTLIPSYSVGDYTIFKPILESLSYLKVLSLPWKISIESGDSEKLNMGRDALKYTVSALSDNHTTLEVGCDYNEGDSIRIYNSYSKKIIASKVIRVRENEIDVIGKIKENGLLLNYSRQISIVFEITTNEHKN